VKRLLCALLLASHCFAGTYSTAVLAQPAINAYWQAGQGTESKNSYTATAAGGVTNSALSGCPADGSTTAAAVYNGSTG
jgi:hypothetical protein